MQGYRDALLEGRLWETWLGLMLLASGFVCRALVVSTPDAACEVCAVSAAVIHLQHVGVVYPRYAPRDALLEWVLRRPRHLIPCPARLKLVLDAGVQALSAKRGESIY